MSDIESKQLNAEPVEPIGEKEPAAAPAPEKPSKPSMRRTLNETQRAQVLLNLEKGRETKRRMKEERLAREAAEKAELDDTKEKLLLKKEAQLARKKDALKKELAVESSESEEEVFVRFDKKSRGKKPKRRRVVYESASSDDEEARARAPTRPETARVRRAPEARSIAFW